MGEQDEGHAILGGRFRLILHAYLLALQTFSKEQRENYRAPGTFTSEPCERQLPPTEY